MGNYRARRDGYLQGWMIDAANYLFQGKDDEEIVRLLWFQYKNPDKKQLSAAKQRLRRAYGNPKFEEYYKSIVTEWSRHNVGKALLKLGEQIDSDQPWLANKAANDVLTQAKKMALGEDENTVTVKIETGIELGTPDGDA